MIKLGWLMLYYWLAYIIVTLIGIFHTIFNIKFLKMKSMKNSPGMGEGYEKTKPWHPLYNIIIFTFFSYLYLSLFESPSIKIVILVSIIWGSITIIFDLIGWVLIKHPWSLSFKEFYVDYQPWITLIYLTIYSSPFIAYNLMNYYDSKYDL